MVSFKDAINEIRSLLVNRGAVPRTKYVFEADFALTLSYNVLLILEIFSVTWATFFYFSANNNLTTQIKQKTNYLTAANEAKFISWYD
jgi:hypothetical protein